MAAPGTIPRRLVTTVEGPREDVPVLPVLMTPSSKEPTLITSPLIFSAPCSAITNFKAALQDQLYDNKKNNSFEFPFPTTLLFMLLYLL